MINLFKITFLMIVLLNKFKSSPLFLPACHNKLLKGGDIKNYHLCPGTAKPYSLTHILTNSIFHLIDIRDSLSIPIFILYFRVVYK